MNVRNEFGDTRLLAYTAFRGHRIGIISQSGRIDIELSAAAWSSVPVVAVTNYGGLRTNIPREEFDEFHLEGQDKHDGSRRSWAGFRPVVKDEDGFAAVRSHGTISAGAGGRRTSRRTRPAQPQWQHRNHEKSLGAPARAA